MKNVKFYTAEKMPAELLVGYLKDQYPLPIDVVSVSDSGGRVKVIDIHEGEADGVSPACFRRA